MSRRAMNAAAYSVAVQMWRDEKSCKAIADAFGTSVSHICRLACNHRDDFPARYGRATDEIVERMHELRDEGMTFEQIAAAVGVSKSTVQRHMRKETR